MKVFNILPFPAKDPNIADYYESRQAVGIRFTFLNKLKQGVYRPIFRPVLCRDYLNDILHAEHFGKSITNPIFGFVYDVKKQKIDRDKTRFLLSLSTPELFQTVLRTMPPLLNSVEKEIGWELSKVFPDEKYCHILLEGDSRWLRSTFLLSIYTLLCRFSGYDKTSVKEIQQYLKRYMTYDTMFFDYTDGNLSKSLKYLNDIFNLYENSSMSPSGFYAGADIGEVHSYSGILGNISNPNKGWYNVNNTASLMIREFLQRAA